MFLQKIVNLALPNSHLYANIYSQLRRNLDAFAMIDDANRFVAFTSSPTINSSLTQTHRRQQSIVDGRRNTLHP
jgi:hypothetical protein